MKKNTTGKQKPKPARKTNAANQDSKREQLTIGMDLGDKTSRYCVLNNEGGIVMEASTATTKKGMAQVFATRKPSRVAMEVGTHSPWVSRLLKSYGHEVIVANARQVRLISQSSRKNDKMDAQTLARLARVDPQLLRPIEHRSEEAQQDLMVIRVRAALVEARTSLVNSARGLAKAAGERLPKCDADQLGTEQLKGLPAWMDQALKPLLAQVESLTRQIKESDQKIEQIARDKHPETKLLKQVNGVGTLIALTYVLTLEDASRFQRSRDVGCYLGLRPKQSDSGEAKPQLRITKEGDFISAS